MLQMSDLDSDTILSIVEEINNKIPYKDIVKQYNISHDTLRNIRINFGGFTDEADIQEKAAEVKVDKVNMNKLIKLPITDPVIVQDIIQQIDNGVPYAAMARYHKISPYYIKKTYLYFRDTDGIESIQDKLRSIDNINNTPKIYVRDNDKHYENNTNYYKDYVKQHRLELKIEQAKRLLLENDISL